MDRRGGGSFGIGRRGVKRVHCPDCDRPEWRQADIEWTAPRRETPKDFALALAVWGLVVAAYVMGGFALWSLTQ